jgi:hypothetical protein
MGHVHFNLNNSGSLHTLASPQVGVSGTLPPNMQGANQGGLYLIVNTQVNGVNRYVGKTGNIEDRFNGRMLTINEFGLAQAQLQGTWAFWGQATVWNTAAPNAPAVQGGAPNYGANQVMATIDGVQVNLEALLIRCVRQIVAGVNNATMTNLQYMNNTFSNTTGNNLTIQIDTCQGGVYNAWQGQHTIPANGQL